MEIQKLVKDYYTKWEALGQWRTPNLADCLDFVATEVAEAIDKRLRTWGNHYVRNHPLGEDTVPADIASEIADVVIMCCVAMDILDYSLEGMIQRKLKKMDAQRMS